MEKRFSRLFLLGIFSLAVVFGIYFVMAASANLASSTAENGTNVTMMWFNVSAINITGGNNLTSVVINNTGTATGLNITAVTISNGTFYTNASFGSSFPSSGVVVRIGKIINATASTNFTVVFTLNTTATDGATIKANVTSFTNESNVSFSTLPYNSSTVTIDTNAPLVQYGGTTLANVSNNTGNLTVGIVASESVSSLYNVTISVNGAVVKTCASSPCNYTNNSADGVYNVTASANDTYGHTNNSLANRTITIDNTNPVPTAACSPATIGKGDTFPCTCTGSDATSGVSTSTGTSNSADGTNIPSVSGDFTYTCSVTDKAGNTANATALYVVTGGSSGGGSSGGSSGTPAKPEVQSFTKVTPGAATIVKDFDSETGIKEIEITVNKETSNVKITVTKESGKPAAVSVEKTGKVYQYLHIETQNLATSLDKAVVKFKVEKSWVLTNKVNKSNVVVSKFDEVGKKWNELSTTPTEEDSLYYYYDVELNSFSYFAISERAIVPVVDDSSVGTTDTGDSTLMSKWVWILLVLVVVVVLWVMLSKKKKRK